jgi:hypothetical protein
MSGTLTLQLAITKLSRFHVWVIRLEMTEWELRQSNYDVVTSFGSSSEGQVVKSN